MAKISNIKKTCNFANYGTLTKKKPKKGIKDMEQTGRKPAQAGSLRTGRKQTSERAINRDFARKIVFVL